MAYPQWLAEVHRVGREQDQEDIPPLPPPSLPPSASSPSEVSHVSSQAQVCPHPVADHSDTDTNKHQNTAALRQEELAASSSLPLYAPRPAISAIPSTPTVTPPQTSSTSVPETVLGVSLLRQPHVITTSLSYQCEPRMVTTRPIMHTQVAPTATQQAPSNSTFSERKKLQTAPPARIPGGQNVRLHSMSHLKPSKIPVMVSGHHRSPFPALKQRGTPQPAKSIHPPPESTPTPSIVPSKTASDSHPVNRPEKDMFTSLLPTRTEQQSPEPTGGHEPLDDAGTSSADLRTELPVSYPDPSSPEPERRPPVTSHQIEPVVADPTKPVVSDTSEEQLEPTEPSDAHSNPASHSSAQEPSRPSSEPTDAHSNPTSHSSAKEPSRPSPTEPSDPHSNPASHSSAQEPSRPSSTDPVKLLEDLTLSSLSESSHDLIHSLQEGAPPTGATAASVIEGVPLEHVGDSPLDSSQASVEQGMETPSPLPSSQSPVEGLMSELDSEVVIVNLLSTLDAHLAGDQESSSLMYTAPRATDDMKEQIATSAVLTSTLTRCGVCCCPWDVCNHNGY